MVVQDGGFLLAAVGVTDDGDCRDAGNLLDFGCDPGVPHDFAEVEREKTS